MALRITDIPLSALRDSQTRNDVVTVDTTSILVAPLLTNNTRKSIVFTNTSTGGQVITISINQTAVSLKGRILYPTGEMVASMDGGYVPSSQEFYAVADGAGASLSISEELIGVV